MGRPVPLASGRLCDDMSLKFISELSKLHENTPVSFKNHRFSGFIIWASKSDGTEGLHDCSLLCDVFSSAKAIKDTSFTFIKSQSQIYWDNHIYDKKNGWMDGWMYGWMYGCM